VVRHTKGLIYTRGKEHHMFIQKYAGWGPELISNSRNREDFLAMAGIEKSCS
jgi:hypothetical protein